MIEFILFFAGLVCVLFSRLSKNLNENSRSKIFYLGVCFQAIGGVYVIVK